MVTDAGASVSFLRESGGALDGINFDRHQVLKTHVREVRSGVGALGQSARRVEERQKSKQEQQKRSLNQRRGSAVRQACGRMFWFVRIFRRAAEGQRRPDQQTRNRRKTILYTNEGNTNAIHRRP